MIHICICIPGANIVLNCFLSPMMNVKLENRVNNHMDPFLFFIINDNLSIETMFPILYKMANPVVFKLRSNNVD